MTSRTPFHEAMAPMPAQLLRRPDDPSPGQDRSFATQVGIEGGGNPNFATHFFDNIHLNVGITAGTRFISRSARPPARQNRVAKSRFLPAPPLTKSQSPDSCQRASPTGTPRLARHQATPLDQNAGAPGRMRFEHAAPRHPLCAKSALNPYSARSASLPPRIASAMLKGSAQSPTA